MFCLSFLMICLECACVLFMHLLNDFPCLCVWMLIVFILYCKIIRCVGPPLLNFIFLVHGLEA